METRIPIENLTPSSVSRARGSEAFDKLKSYLTSDDVEISFKEKDLVSISFLDELVLRLLESHYLRRVIFVATTQDLREKLAQVAAIRNAEIFVRARAGQPKTLVKPKRVPEITIQHKKA